MPAPSLFNTITLKIISDNFQAILDLFDIVDKKQESFETLMCKKNKDYADLPADARMKIYTYAINIHDAIKILKHELKPLWAQLEQQMRENPAASCRNVIAFLKEIIRHPRITAEELQTRNTHEKILSVLVKLGIYPSLDDFLKIKTNVPELRSEMIKVYLRVLNDAGEDVEALFLDHNAMSEVNWSEKDIRHALLAKHPYLTQLILRVIPANAQTCTQYNLFDLPLYYELKTIDGVEHRYFLLGRFMQSPDNLQTNFWKKLEASINIYLRDFNNLWKKFYVSEDLFYNKKTLQRALVNVNFIIAEKVLANINIKFSELETHIIETIIQYSIAPEEHKKIVEQFKIWHATFIKNHQKITEYIAQLTPSQKSQLIPCIVIGLFGRGVTPLLGAQLLTSFTISNATWLDYLLSLDDFMLNDFFNDFEGARNFFALLKRILSDTSLRTTALVKKITGGDKKFKFNIRAFCFVLAEHGDHELLSLLANRGGNSGKATKDRLRAHVEEMAESALEGKHYSFVVNLRELFSDKGCVGYYIVSAIASKIHASLQKKGSVPTQCLELLDRYLDEKLLQELTKRCSPLNIYLVRSFTLAFLHHAKPTLFHKIWNSAPEEEKIKALLEIRKNNVGHNLQSDPVLNATKDFAHLYQRSSAFELPAPQTKPTPTEAIKRPIAPSSDSAANKRQAKSIAGSTEPPVQPNSAASLKAPATLAPLAVFHKPAATSELTRVPAAAETTQPTQPDKRKIEELSIEALRFYYEKLKKLALQATTENKALTIRNQELETRNKELEAKNKDLEEQLALTSTSLQTDIVKLNSPSFSM